MIHELKTEHQYFEDIASGKKPFEVRKNDRDFEVGDFLALNEISDDFKYTGRCCLVEITYVLDDTRFVKDGFATLGIRPCAIVTMTQNMSYISSRNLFAVDVYKRSGENG